MTSGKDIVAGTEMRSDRDGGGHARLRVAKRIVEWSLVLLFALTAGALVFQTSLFDGKIVVDAGTAKRFLMSGYADEVAGGASTYRAGKVPLSWVCDLKASSSPLYCGQEVVFDGNGAVAGKNLDHLKYAEITFDYAGPSKTLQFALKNQAPGHSTHGDRSNAKLNRVEFTARDGLQTVRFTPKDLRVPDWWIFSHGVAPELGRTELDNVVAIELGVGGAPVVGVHELRVSSFVLVYSRIPMVHVYLGIILIWAAWLATYAVLRALCAEREQREREQAEADKRAALAQAVRAAERASEFKSNFLTGMSHELRTPLNAVLGYAQLLERAGLPSEHQTAVQTIRRSGAHLLSLITELLDLSKIEAGKIEIYPDTVNLYALLDQVADMIRVRTEEKGLAFQQIVGDDVPEWVVLDAKRLSQILLNLLSNAVRFTNEGRVSLRVHRLASSHAGATLRFEVQDSGAGIAEEDLSSIFRPYEQVGPMELREAGTGLGLMICQQLAKLIGSKLQVQSRVGQGSVFWFDVEAPLSCPDVTATMDDAETVVGYVGPARRVLVVDGDATGRDVLADLLGELGFDVAAVEDGRSAIVSAQRSRPDLIVMDLETQGMEAARVVEMLRLLDGLGETPVLMTSADAGPQPRERARIAGADGFISKPVSLCELLALIGEKLAIQWLKADASGDAARRGPEGPGTPSAAAGRGRPGSRLHVLLADDNETNQIVLSKLLEVLGARSTVVWDGVEALDAFKAGGFDLVFLDANMPRMGGVEAARAIRRFEFEHGLRPTPIYACSANVDLEDVAAYTASGMDGAVGKPLDLQEVAGVLTRVSEARPAPAVRKRALVAG